MHAFKKYLKLFQKYRTVIILIPFVLWMIFLDHNSLLEHIKYSKKKRFLLAQKEFYLQKIKEDSLKIHYINTDFERYAREEFFMHKPNEEIFIIKNKTQ